VDDLASKDSRDIKRCLHVLRDSFGVRVYAVAVSNDDDYNETLKIPATAGEALCAEVYDLVSDCYYVVGAGWHDIGIIPVNYRLSMESVCGSEIDIPLPPSVIRRYMATSQKENFNAWKSGFRGKKYTIKFLQVLNVY
jgi:hypothetical protein